MKKIGLVVAFTIALAAVIPLFDKPNFSFAFTMPSREDITLRKLDWQELRFYRRAVGKINRIAWFCINLDERYWVPNNLEKYQNWCPISGYWAQYAEHPKLILAILDEYLVARLEYGHLIDWNNMLAGPAARNGFYRVLEKKRDKVSSYRTEDGRPIPMPNALRIFGRVWAHGGDAYGPHHVGKGCLNYPNDYAEKVFEWAEEGTPVALLRSWQ